MTEERADLNPAAGRGANAAQIRCGGCVRRLTLGWGRSSEWRLGADISLIRSQGSSLTAMRTRSDVRVVQTITRRAPADFCRERP